MTADRSAAADTLRDELAALYPGMGLLTVAEAVDAVMALVDRYAAAQVAAERERIAAEIDALPSYDQQTNRALDEAASIARGQP